MKHIILSLGLFFFQLTFAQSQQNDLAVGIGASAVPHFDKNRVGVDISARYYFSDAFSAGVQFIYLNPKFNHGFGYDTDRTVINTYGINIPIQYDVVNTEKITLGLGFSNGLLLNVLRNRNETREVEYYDSDSGVATVWNVPVRLKTDSYYILTPYADLSYKALTLDKYGTSLFITGKACYQSAFGRGSFSNHKDFTNYVVSFGVTIKGTTN